MKRLLSLEPKSGCIAQASTILGNKWTALLLRDLATGTKRFCELERSLTGISPRTLSQRLDDLVDNKIISKHVFNEGAPHTEYSLTDKGKDLLPILKQMAHWGAKYS